MGFLELLSQKPAKQEKSLGVCIPDHAKPKNSKSEEISTFPSSFLVEGTYEIKREVTLTGKLLSGEVKKISRLNYDGSHVPIKEIVHHGKTVDALEKGQTGAIRLEPEHYLKIISGSIVEFE